MFKAAAALSVLLAALALPGGAAASGDPEVAALQVGLRKHGLYAGTIDGVLGSRTRSSLVRLQRRAGIRADGVPDRRTRAALGRYGRGAPLGSRPLRLGARGWDVAALQFSLAWHGFPSGPFDGRLGVRTESALRRFQGWARLLPDGVAGPATIAALRRPVPRVGLALVAPSDGPTGDGFGPRGNRFHSALDFIAPVGAPVSAAAGGRVVYAGSTAGGWGSLVVLAHGSGVRTMYAHLSRIDVRLGRRIAAGARVGLVGVTGRATGPHLHFEVRLRGAAVDPVPAMEFTRDGRRTAPGRFVSG